MGRSYFISDVHLGMTPTKSEKQKEKKLLSFLDHVATSGERLFIVGDLFDFWFEYRTVIPRGYMRALSAINNLRELGKELYYIAGNHDFWVRDFLTTELNIPVYFDALDIKINGKRFYLHHGDGIAKNDSGYRFMKRIFRHPANIFLYSLLHPDLGIPLAKWVSNLSRNQNNHTGPVDDSDYREDAMLKFRDGFDYVIFGHLHSPSIQHYGEKTYLNLGDWINHFTYAVFDEHEIQLLTWKRG